MALIMFPQIVETIYSPALPAIATGFAVSHHQAGLTLSWYFLAFAIGVVVWGYLCDVLGRRAAVLLALLLYAVASFGACYAQNFTVLLLCRILMAFAAAIGSIGSQTMMRDVLTPEQLSRVFAITGIALAISPIVGLISGAVLVDMGGYQAVFWALALLAILLLSCCLFGLPETRPIAYQRPLFWPTLYKMALDKHIIHTAILIALFNTALFAYYQLAPFMMERLGLGTAIFGYSGVLMGLGALIGAMLNRHLINRGWPSQRMVLLACVLAFVSAIALWSVQHQLVFVLPMLGIAMAYALAIPNILAHALKNYPTQVGTAGAILGLFYYTLIGIGLMLVGNNQNLGLCLSVIASLLLLLTYCNPNKNA